MVLIQTLLPVSASGADGEGDERVRQTRRELVDVFGGLTAYLQNPAQGVWTSREGEREGDAVVLVEIVTALRPDVVGMLRADVRREISSRRHSPTGSGRRRAIGVTTWAEAPMLHKRVAQ
jgi:hypothetical protein